MDHQEERIEEDVELQEDQGMDPALNNPNQSQSSTSPSSDSVYVKARRLSTYLKGRTRPYGPVDSTDGFLLMTRRQTYRTISTFQNPKAPDKTHQKVAPRRMRKRQRVGKSQETDVSEELPKLTISSNHQPTPRRRRRQTAARRSDSRTVFRETAL